MVQVDILPKTEGISSNERRVIVAASLGTVFEFYDFFLIGLLANEISKAFFSGVNPTAGFIFTLLGFAAGFLLRPFGAIVFGRLGDMAGRKYTFLVTILLMGISTFTIGLLPAYSTIGLAAPLGFVAMRMLQGLALGGEFGGALIYVAEHAPANRRAAWTAWVILTAALGFLLAVAVIIPLRLAIGADAFSLWGWRAPFLVSILLLGVSLWIRLKLDETPEFIRMKAEGKASKAPISETLGTWKNLRLVLIAALCIVPGQAVVWYTGQFYSLFFLTKVLRIENLTANFLLIAATIITAPLYVVFGALSDRIGRRPVYVAGFLLAAVFTVPLFKALTHYGNPTLEQAQINAPITIVSGSDACSVQFNPLGTAKPITSCDIVVDAIAKLGLNYNSAHSAESATTIVKIGDREVPGYSADTSDVSVKKTRFESELKTALTDMGYPLGEAAHEDINQTMIVVLLSILLCFGTMTFAPSTTALLEMFPSRIRYTAMSFPYHLSAAWFGGFLPATAFAIVASTGNIYSGLYYPACIAAACIVLSTIFANETKGADLSGD
ncbi:major facilitator superfamily MFS_1 (plasmid) [Rhizobium leguminosarum bv. trifolii WSM2304]|uniref:Major facilitator superfamily MFS_1 n=1 Tax=Rhizobium leguminosarum bv. trifolii (strain WSM2304) TaxID=395492 RepID=A0ABF7QYZ6_RHILW|nr:MFS transporter [Rhizobium leguminosarum]ACI59503.1 major facilitator superfamily MFS_1 [Rhizobium leguminosarum bv. trifolii WSM2304]